LDRIHRLTSTLSGASESDNPEEGDEGREVKHFLTARTATDFQFFSILLLIWVGPEYALLAREMSTEQREYGMIPVKVYLSYISACGRFLSFLYLLFAFGYEVVRVYTNFWLKEWSDEISQSSDDDYDGVMEHYFNVYVILSVVTVLVSLASNLIGKQAGANSREELHNKMLNRVVRCPMKFFDTTPIGRILNRFSSDCAVVDRVSDYILPSCVSINSISANTLLDIWFFHFIFRNSASRCNDSFNSFFSAYQQLW